MTRRWWWPARSSIRALVVVAGLLLQSFVVAGSSAPPSPVWTVGHVEGVLLAGLSSSRSPKRALSGDDEPAPSARLVDEEFKRPGVAVGALQGRSSLLQSGAGGADYGVLRRNAPNSTRSSSTSLHTMGKKSRASVPKVPPNHGEEAPMAEADRARRNLRRAQQENDHGKEAHNPNQQLQLELLMILGAAGLGCLVGCMCFPPGPGYQPRRQPREEEQLY